MPRVVTPDPLDMTGAWNVQEERLPVARVLFPVGGHIEDPPELVRSIADQVPWDEEEYPDPPELTRQHAGNGIAVEWSSSEEEEDDDLETLSASSDNSDDSLQSTYRQDFEQRCQELANEGELIREEINTLINLIGQPSVLTDEMGRVNDLIGWANEMQNNR